MSFLARTLEKLRSLYIEPELQFRFVVSLLVIVTLESLFVGRGLMNLLFLSGEWQRPALLVDFFLSLFWLLVPLVVFNTLIGLYWSLRIARPMKALHGGLRDMREGRLGIVEARPRDALRDLVLSFNLTAGRLKSLLSRDYRLVREVIADLKSCQEAKPEEVKKILIGCRSKLSIVNTHFFKGE